MSTSLKTFLFLERQTSEVAANKATLSVCSSSLTFLSVADSQPPKRLCKQFTSKLIWSKFSFYTRRDVLMIHPGAFSPRVTHPSLELSSAKILICTDLCNNSWKHFSSGRYVTIVREVKRWQSYQHPLQNLKRGVVWGCEGISYHGFKWLLVFHLTGPPYSQCQNGKELQLTRDARTWHVFI